MQLIRTTRLVITFYRSFAFAPLLLTIASMLSFLQYGFSIFGTLLWFKIITNALIWGFINRLKHKEFYYYQNLGISRKLLWTTVFSFDLIVFITSILIIKQYR